MKQKNNWMKWGLLLLGVGLGFYALRKSKTTTTNTIKAELQESEQPTQNLSNEEIERLAQEYAQQQQQDEQKQVEEQPITPPHESAAHQVVSIWVDDFVNAINEGKTINDLILILRRLGNREDVELFKDIVKESYGMTVKELFSYLTDDAITKIFTFFGGSEPTVYLFEGITAPETKTRVTTSSYSSSSEPIDPATQYKGRSGNSSTSSTTSSRSSSSTTSSRSTSSTRSAGLKFDTDLNKLKLLML